MADASEKDKVRIHVVLGDRTQDGKLDVTVQIEGRLPLIGWVPSFNLTRNLPLKEVLSGAQLMCGALPSPAREAAVMAFSIARGIVAGLEAF